MSDARLRVLIVSPNSLARTGLGAVLQAVDDLKIVGAGAPGEAASLAAQLLPDAVVLDAGAGEPEELDAIARLSTGQPGLPIVALAAQPLAVAQALSFGASALLPSAVDVKTLALALRAAAHGLVSVPRADVAALLPVDEALEVAVKAPVETLTPRELEVLQLMARGLTNRQIGRQLKISEHTVKFHAAAILGKLNARSRAEAVARAIGLGWILV